MKNLYLALLLVVGSVTIGSAQQIAAHYQAHQVAVGGTFYGMDDAGNVLYRRRGPVDMVLERVDGTMYTFPHVPGTNAIGVGGGINGNGEVLLIVRNPDSSADLRSFDMATQTFSDPYWLPFNIDLAAPINYTNDHQYTLYGEDTGVSFDAIYGNSPTYADYIYAPNGEQQAIAELGEGGWMITGGQFSASDHHLYHNGQYVRGIPRTGYFDLPSTPNANGEFTITLLHDISGNSTTTYVRDADNRTLYQIPSLNAATDVQFYSDSGIAGGYSGARLFDLPTRRAFLWSHLTGPVDLTSITLNLPSGSRILDCGTMNRNGQIVVRGISSTGVISTYRLDPVPEPASLFTLGIGLAALANRKRSTKLPSRSGRME